MSKVLVTGGTGYIGSHTIIDLINNGFEVVSIDNLTNSNDDVLEGIEKITGVKVTNYRIDLVDLASLLQVFRDHPDIEGIIHFAAYKLVGESVEKPLAYFRNNLLGLINLLTCMETFEVANLIFSSSCSVYGNAEELPVTENTPFQEAESPYARTKQMGEQIIRDFAKVHPDHQAVLLRYFNPAGAHESAIIGEAPSNPASNLVPVITETAIGKRKSMTVFGADYDTRDGSCIRDYIHVMDLANAHTKSLQFLLQKKNATNCEIFNLGIGEGVSVLEAIKAFEKVSGEKLNYEIGPRRPGDVVAIYADKERSERELGWKPERDIDAIMESAWAWERARSGK
ncbi:UDP-glucose 4-epimerase GalE [Flavilitoribacter nigricans]|uniref:UDP-glucose 4-epimerase n=1 Tax=Flavilitoribacter nigricans (strain ATCC 23147 / DSM 23189 / NBRC 102662 / NCIMB 1420 / SS-2) TaxID=1122177 RepID=A0A2D0N4K1_FLAN2|nr:UDP-glucose 4-epimerase GalE [Flavilitoribacter nigricans]PHN03069.1 UDP-glucose 4-epimerase GalE [Flavilitoribacter nigricans DSM 23189 = NBRC 102662]